MFSSLFISIFSGVSQKTTLYVIITMKAVCSRGSSENTKRSYFTGKDLARQEERLSETLTWQFISAVLLGLG